MQVYYDKNSHGFVKGIWILLHLSAKQVNCGVGFGWCGGFKDCNFLFLDIVDFDLPILAESARGQDLEIPRQVLVSK